MSQVAIYDKYDKYTNYSNQFELQDDIVEVEVEVDYEYDWTDEYKESGFGFDSDSYPELTNYYPTTPDIDLWESFLNRNLTQDEKTRLLDVIMENDINNQLKSLHRNIFASGSYIISKLTKLAGNCLFESLSSLDYGSPYEIRKNISAIMLLVRAQQDFFPKLDISPEQIFNNGNYIPSVYVKSENEMYAYNYDMMIIDLNNNYSWTRVPTELVLMVISRIYQVKIKIFHNKTQYVNIINVWDGIIPDDEIDEIHLGHINEEHYVPVVEIDEDIKNNFDIYSEYIKKVPQYTEAKNKFNNWAKNLVNQLATGLTNNDFINDFVIVNPTHDLTHDITHDITHDLTHDLTHDIEAISDFQDFMIVS